MFVKITRDTFLSGTPAFAGETYEVDEHTARQVVKTNKGEIIAAPEDSAPAEPPKPKIKKVGGKKSADDNEPADA